jgi:hypothetical protein
MPCYYFDIHDGKELQTDENGVELPDIRAARDEATTALCGLAKDYIPHDGSRRDMWIAVRDQGGAELMRVSLSFSVQTPAAMT